MLRKRLLWAALCAAVILLAAVGARADFITIVNPHNLPDTLGDGYGAVPYTYQISRTAVSIAEWDLFYNDATSGKVGTFNPAYNYWNDGTRNVGSNAPAVNISFNHVAQYVNWLTTGDATQGAYTIDAGGAVTGIMSREQIVAAGNLYYLIPTEDEWYKAAYFKPDGSGYSLYAHGLDSVPPRGSDGLNNWNFNNALDPPSTWTVDTGTEEQNGTLNMMGNVWEWNETPIGGSSRRVRGGVYNTASSTLAASAQPSLGPSYEGIDTGFRVASIPEPGGATMLMGAVGLLLWRRRRTA